jgi:hypothetical protein
MIYSRSGQPDQAALALFSIGSTSKGIW